MKQMKWLAVLCAASLFAGCSTQGSPTLPNSGSSNGSASALRPLAHTHGKGHLILRIKVPKKKHTARGHRPTYVSPATQSMVVAIAGPTAVNQTVNLTATSAGCTSTLTNTACQLSIALAAGAYSATITTYDAVNGAGNKLSAAQAVAFTVVAGASNTVALTLSGIPSQIVVTPGSGYSSTNASGTIDLFGTGANRMILEALDADGNIIAGAGSPAYVVNKAFGGLGVSLTQPTAGAPNAFYVTPPSGYSGSTATLSVQAAFNTAQTDGCAQTGANCFTTVTVDMVQLFSVASTSGFSVFENGQSTPFATVAGLSGVSAIAMDPAGNVYVSSPSAVTVYQPPYSAAAFNLNAAGIANPRALHFDGSGNLFVANCPTCVGAGLDSIAEYASPITAASTPAVIATNGIAQPSAIVDDGGTPANIFVANVTGNSGTGSVTEYASPYSGAPTVTMTDVTIANPNALAFDKGTSGPALYVSNPSKTVDRYRTSNLAVPNVSYSNSVSGGACFAGGTPTPVINKPEALALNDVGGNRALFIANSSSGTVNAVVQFSLTSNTCTGIFPNPGGNPVGFAIDSFSQLYEADNLANQVNVWSTASGAVPGAPNQSIGFTAPIGIATAP